MERRSSSVQSKLNIKRRQVTTSLLFLALHSNNFFQSRAINMLTLVVRSAALVFLSSTSLVSSSPLHARTPYAVKESHNVPSMWTDIGRAPADRVINLHIGLRQGRFDELERHLYEGTSSFSSCSMRAAYACFHLYSLYTFPSSLWPTSYQ